MTKKRKKKKKAPVTGRVNSTIHSEAMADPKIKELVEILRVGWKAMEMPERSERLIALTKLRCSARGLEKELHQSATSIRRYLVRRRAKAPKAETPPPLVAVRTVLEQRAVEDADKRRKKRLEDEARTGSVSDKIATRLLKFCRAEEGVPESQILKADLAGALESAEIELNLFEASHFREILIPKKISIREVFQMSCPQEHEGEFWLIHRGRWIAKIVWAYAPERVIWQRALQKVYKRADELDPPAHPLKNFWKHQLRIKTIGETPPRPHYPGGARSMKRQGKPPGPGNGA